LSTQPNQRYRRIAALLKRERRSDGLARVNRKRVYRLMKKKHGLLLERGSNSVALMSSKLSNGLAERSAIQRRSGSTTS